MSGLLTAAVGAAAIMALSPATGAPATIPTTTAAVQAAAIQAAIPGCPHDIWNGPTYQGDPTKGSTGRGPSYSPNYAMARPPKGAPAHATRGCVGVGSGSEAVSGSATGGAGVGGAGAGGAGAGGAGGAGAGGAGGTG